MTGPHPAAIAGARFAFQVVRPGSPMLRIRYRAGIAVDPFGGLTDDSPAAPSRATAASRASSPGR
jgi:hypothetical protein